MAEYETYSFSAESESCYGLEVVKRTLEDQGHKVYPFDPPSDRPVLVSLYWPEQLYDFIKWRYRRCMKDREIIVGGNYPTTSPQALLPFDVSVYMGDGELFNGVDYFAGKTRKRAIAPRVMPIIYEDVQQTRRTFCEISRGCKNRCLFCQYGWLKPYREASLADIGEIIKRAKTKSIRVFAADRFNHSRYEDIRRLMERAGKNDTGSDVSIREILNKPHLLNYTRKVRVGVEGLSHRLRKSVGKPYTNDQIVEFCDQVARAGIRSLDWYMIYGLPGEEENDAREFEELLKGLDQILPAGYTIAIHWNALSPSAQTPYQWFRPATGKPHYLAALFDSRPNQRIKIMHKPQFTSDWTMIRRTLAVRSNHNTRKLVYNFAINEARFKKHPKAFLGLFKEVAGFDLLGELPTDRPLPWDEFCDYERDKMLRLWESR